MAKSSASLVYVDDFKECLRTDVPQDKAPLGSLVRAENLRWLPSGGFALRGGSKHITAWTPSTSAAILNMEVMREFDVLFVQSGTKILHTRSKTSPLYSVGVVLTTGKRADMVEYNSTLKFSNGYEPYGSIAVAQVKTQFTDASSSVQLKDGYGYFFRTPKSGTVTATAATDRLALTAHGFQNGDRVAFYSSGTLPAGLSALTEYFVVNKKTDDFQVSATVGGSPVDLTSTGSGTHTVTDGIAYCKGNMITYTKKNTATFTADSDMETFTATAHGLANGVTVTVSNSGGALPAGLTAGTVYFVINTAPNTFQLATSPGGDPVAISDAGTGTHSFNGGDSLGGTVRIPSGTYAVDEIVTQVTDIRTAPRATVMDEAFEKIVAGGVLIASHVEYYSETASAATPDNIDDFTPAANRELFGKYGKITAMKTLLNRLYVAKDKGIEVWTDIDSLGIPVRYPFTGAYGIVNASSLIEMGDRLCFFTNQKRFKTIEPTSTSANPEPEINPYFDTNIEGTLRLLDYNQAGASMGFNERDFLMRGTVMENSVRKTLVFDALRKGWSVDIGTSPNCWVEFQGATFFGSATTDKIYQAETEYKDGDTSPKLRALTPVHWVGDKRREVHVGIINLVGAIKTQTQATVTIYLDGVSHKVFTIQGTADYVDTTQARPLGREMLGLDTLGYGADEDPSSGFAFEVPIEVNFMAKNVQILIECQGTGFGFRLDSYDIVEGDEESPTDTQADIY